MKLILLIYFLLSTGAKAECLPGSMYLPPSAHADFRISEDVVKEFEAEIQDIYQDNDLIIKLEPLNPRVNAEINKNESEVTIKIMGGMLAHPLMNKGALKLLLCHEVGHLLGGPPLKSRNGWSSTEGQADYYSGSVCARSMGFDEDSLIDSAIKLTTIYAEVTRELPPKLNSCDSKEVERTNFGYPPVQCRLDTIWAGWQNKNRPRCWFKN